MNGPLFSQSLVHRVTGTPIDAACSHHFPQTLLLLLNHHVDEPSTRLSNFYHKFIDISDICPFWKIIFDCFEYNLAWHEKFECKNGMRNLIPPVTQFSEAENSSLLLKTFEWEMPGKWFYARVRTIRHWQLKTQKPLHNGGREIYQICFQVVGLFWLQTNLQLISRQEAFLWKQQKQNKLAKDSFPLLESWFCQCRYFLRIFISTFLMFSFWVGFRSNYIIC